MSIEIGQDQVVITQAELDQYKEFELWVLDYIDKNGYPCHAFRSKFPKFKPWYDENKNKEKRLAQQKKLDEKIALLVPFLEGLPNPYEAGKGIVLALSRSSEYSELLPKPEVALVKGSVDPDEDEYEDEEC